MMRSSRARLPLAAFAATVGLLTGCKQPRASALLTPDSASLARAAPDSFRVEFQTSKGAFIVQAVRAWAPVGVDRFHFLVTNNFYDGTRFFRVLPTFVVQFGIHGDPQIAAVWKSRSMPDDPVTQSNQAGYLTYATSGPNTRTTQLFVNKGDNSRLDAMGFAPIGRIVDGMQVVDQLYAGYGEGPPRGGGPDQGLMGEQGTAYLERQFPLLDSIVRVRVLKD